MNIELLPLKNPANIRIKIPGSKSYTNRALILASLTKGVVEIINPLFSDDTNAMIDCLKTLGIKINIQPEKIVVAGDISDVKNSRFILNANLSATTIRFILALCYLTKGEKILTGKPGLLMRPIKDLVDGLKKLGAKIVYLDKKGFPPVKVFPMVSVMKTKNIKLNGNISSQFLSALLMTAPILGEIKIEVGNLTSIPYVDMTIEMLNRFGINVVNENYKKFIVFKDQTYKANAVMIEGDYSSATYFAAAAAITKSTVVLENLKTPSKQADAKFFKILEEMGNKITRKSSEITVEGKGVKPVTVDMKDCPDSIQTLAVLSSFAKGQTKISGIQTLKFKETNRVNAIASQLKKMKIKTEVIKNVLIIYGGNPKSAIIKTYDDHRMAMSFAVVGSKLNGIIIENPKVVDKTFPLFWEEIKKLGIGIKKIEPSKLVLIGFMGAGKSSVAPLLAKKLNKEAVEMDLIIAKKAKRESVAQIFEKDGEKTFRLLELKTAKKLEQKKDIVISTGGGVIMNSKLMEHLKKDSLVVFLDTEFETIKKRLADFSDRPLWKNEKKTKELFDTRLPLYYKYSDFIVKTDGKSLGMIVNEVNEVFENLESL